MAQQTTTGPTAPARAPQTPRRRWTPGRIVTISLGALAAILGSLMLAVGLTLLPQLEGEGIDLGEASYDGAGFAVSSAALDWSTEDYLGADLQSVRFDVTTDDGAPVVLGLAAPEDAERELPGEPRAIDSGYRFGYTEHLGEASGINLAELDIWTAQAEGVTLEFTPAEQAGERVLVIASADGQPLGATEIASRADVPGMAGLGVGILAGSVVLLAGGVVLVVVPVRRIVAEKRGGPRGRGRER